ncbi:hypothetical protein BROC_02218 [Candidatus Brocadiaceae bacterium]|nr:hypothetical protein BROC_02218 [Candidatus Brocadiaceae bacterium]
MLVPKFTVVIRHIMTHSICTLALLLRMLTNIARHWQRLLTKFYFCMPKNSLRSTLLRQWEMMQLLTIARSESKSEGRWVKASEITEQLHDIGYRVSQRTVQRDLKELAEVFPIELNEKNPREYGWRWMKGTTLSIPGITVPQALAICLVEIQLSRLLPKSILDNVNGLFSLAKSKLRNAEKHNFNLTKSWIDKIRVVAPSQPLLPPIIDSESESNIYPALLDDKQIRVLYQALDDGVPSEYRLHPLGLIMRGSVSYLVACAWEYSDTRLYALHRFKEVHILDTSSNVPESFSLDSVIANGLADFANQGEPINLEIRCNENVVAYLSETPLSLNQAIKPDIDGWSLITASVNDTWQLRWWLLGQGANVTVIAPEELHQEIKMTLRDALTNYA